jgi:hypothetical protein
MCFTKPHGTYGCQTLKRCTRQRSYIQPKRKSNRANTNSTQFCATIRFSVYQILDGIVIRDFVNLRFAGSVFQRVELRVFVRTSVLFVFEVYVRTTM